jgi:hypothetical protein
MAASERSRESAAIVSVAPARIRVRGWHPTDRPAGSELVGTALYAAPDGWSQVLRTLADGAAVVVSGTEGNFLRVVTRDGTVGYVSETARDHLTLATET